jgi:CBS domain-containing protein
MGELALNTSLPPDQLRSFVRRLLNDVRALEIMIADGWIETGQRRIGAEQELVLVNSAWRPTPVADDALAILNDPHFTNEIALFNLEINLDPLTFGGDCLSRLERQINELIGKARYAANGCDAEIALTGILPTVRKSDLELVNMTPRPRYFALNDALKKQRGWAYEFRLKGVDEMVLRHDSWMLEACCTSFQIHFQTGAEEFANLYNIAQIATAPVLAAAANSPLMFGRRLWKETRIPLFEQSVDTRNASYHLRERSPRVSFGDRWIRRSVLELYKEDIARFHVLVGGDCEEDPFHAMSQGLAPSLNALRLYNGTVWRWNRACYGVINNRPHLRIEARALPSGPSVVDEVANAAFFFGLMSGLSHIYEEITDVMEFEDARANFLAASQSGLDAQFRWIGGEVIPARELICKQLVDVARRGLEISRVDPADINRYLGILEQRVGTGRTGAQWLLSSYADMRKKGTRDEALSSLTSAMVNNQMEGLPVHEWPPSRVTAVSAAKHSYLRVEEFMTTELFTVHEDEPVDLVANLMVWKQVRHIPVEDEKGILVGMVSSIDVLRELERRMTEGSAEPTSVSSIMTTGMIAVPPDTPTLEAIALMRRERVDCLPVVRQGRLIGIVTERDFINVAARLLEQQPD